MSQEFFDAYYFAHSCGRPYVRDDHWLTFFNTIAEQISTRLQPTSVLDAGCAMGFLVEKLREHGVEAFGIDRKIHRLIKGKRSIWRMDDPEIGVIPINYLLHPYTDRFFFDPHFNAVFIDTMHTLNPGHN